MTSGVALGSRAVAGRKVTARKAVISKPRAAVAVQASGDRKWNFSAGPACLPLDVLEEMKEDLVNYKCVFLACRRTPRDVSSYSSDPTRRIARPSRPARALASRSARFRARTSTAAVEEAGLPAVLTGSGAIGLPSMGLAGRHPTRAQRLIGRSCRPDRSKW